MSERMDNKQAIEEVKRVKSQIEVVLQTNKDFLKKAEQNNLPAKIAGLEQSIKINKKELQALDIAIDSLEREKGVAE